MKNRIGLPLLSTIAALIIVGGNARASTITFEGFPDSTILTNQYQAMYGIEFTSAEIITAQYSLDEQDFPPHSGVNVAIDNGGPMIIDFSSPVTSFSGYFTYTEPLTLQAEDALGNALAGLSATSLFDMNFVSSFDSSLGNAPNELIQVGNGSTAFSSVTITGDPGGFSFAVDDVSSTAVPEPGSALLMAGAGAVLLVFGKLSRLRARRGILLTAGLVAGVLSASAQTITATASQSTINPNRPTNVTITAAFSEAPIVTGVLLQEVNSAGTITNPNFGTLAMIDPTTFTVTTPIALPIGGTSQLQISAGFKGKLKRVVSNVVAIAATNLSVSFSGNITIFQDMNGSAPAIANPVFVDNPTENKPVAYTSGNTMMASITFAQNPVPAAAIANVTVTGTITNGPKGPTKFSANNVTLPAAGTATVMGLTADAPLMANLVQYFSTANPMTIDWSYTVNGATTAIGTSSNPVYVTFAAPLNATVYLTDLKFAVSRPGAMTLAQARDNTWALFTANPGPANITTWDGRLLQYYPTGTDFSGCATNERALLTSAAGAGQCGSFAFLLAGAFNANGISVTGGGLFSSLITVQPKAPDNAFLVDNWIYGAGTSGDANYPYSLVFNPAAGGLDMVPVQPGGVYGDLTSIAGLAGQNSPTPSEKAFARHFIILPDAPLNNMYYDPSYGVTYTDANDFEVKATAGYIPPQTAIMMAAPGNTFLDRMTFDAKGAQLKNMSFSR